MLICFRVDFETWIHDVPKKDRKLLKRLRTLADGNQRICLRLTPKDPDLFELTNDPGDWIATAGEVEDWSELPDP